MFRRRLLCLLLSVTFAAPLRAVILLGTGDTTVNTTRPDLTDGAGWDYEGTFNGFLGTPVGPHHFLTASHIGGGPGQAFTYAGQTYLTVKSYADPGGSDLRVWQVDGTFPRFAPLFGRPGAEIGLGLYVFGRGTQRGAEVHVPAGDPMPATLAGWGWGAGDGVQRWGRNVVSGLDQGYLLATFDAAGSGDSVGSDEAALSAGDSGGGVFVRDTDGTWKLAGINYGVSGPYSYTSDGANNFLASLFHTEGLFEANDNGGFSASGGPGLFAATAVASRLGFLNVATGRVPLARVGDDVLFSFASQNGQSYQVQVCDDLAAGAWTALGAPVAGDGNLVLVTDLGGANYARRFYRAVTLSGGNRAPTRNASSAQGLQ